jgi:peptidoglycan/xylan/chitin deacetylase (PgdA/CDA1 family)
MPSLYRPPYGIFSAGGLAGVRARGLDTLLWSRWGRDWGAHATPGSIAAKVTEELSGGDVLLLHDADWYSAPGSHRNTAAALPRVIDAIEARGLPPVAV